MAYQFTLKQILNIAAKNLHKSVAEMNHCSLMNLHQQFPHPYANAAEHFLQTDLTIMMKRIRWHLLQLSPGPNSYVVNSID